MRIVRFAGSSEAGSWRLRLLETLEPLAGTDDNYVVSLERTVAAPLVKTIVWTSGVLIQKELVADDVRNTWDIERTPEE